MTPVPLPTPPNPLHLFWAAVALIAAAVILVWGLGLVIVGVVL